MLRRLVDPCESATCGSSGPMAAGTSGGGVREPGGGSSGPCGARAVQSAGTGWVGSHFVRPRGVTAARTIRGPGRSYVGGQSYVALHLPVVAMQRWGPYDRRPIPQGWSYRSLCQVWPADDADDPSAVLLSAVPYGW
jgi:hypothetical protein